MPIFAVTAELPGQAPEMLAAAGELRAVPGVERLAPEQLQALVEGATVAVTMLYDRVDDELLAAAGPGLRGVCNVAVGFDNIDLAACARRGVVVANTPGVLDDATADIAFGLILAARRRLGEGERLIRAGRPWRWGMGFMLGHDLRGACLGIIGLGGIGARVAERGRAFGMEIAYHSRRESPAAADLGAARLDLDELLASSDVVSIHTPLSGETHHLIGARELALMKPTATLVNTARGAVVDEAALVAALRDGTIAAAGLDVFEHEPDVQPGLLELENAVLVPHLGSATVETRAAMAELAARNAIAIASGEDPPTPVELPGQATRGDR
ncbi:MAG TPA: D-glycerate dehydrogenase [Solirubrobacterales bacterium]|nr:D-glycerate dehydrogenase [Solirubrobacterales bacterium]